MSAYSASTLVKKYTRAVTKQRESREYLSGLTAQAPAECIPKWSTEVTDAEEKRPQSVKAMDIYRAKVPKPKGRKEIEVELGQQELQGNRAGQAGWISQGLKVEEAQ